MIAENPSNPDNLVAGGLYQAPSVYNSSVYYSSGVSGASTSFDGGKSWITQDLPPSPMWTNMSSPQCGHIHLADTAIGFGPNDTVYYVDLSYYSPPPGTSCTGSLASFGLYVTVSDNGGRNWNTPVGIAAMNAGGFVDKPWIAVDQATGYVYVAYTDDGNGSQIYLQRSTDQGLTWTRPLDISSASGVSGTMLGVEIAVDPWGGVDAAWIAETSSQLWFTKSTDHGGTFSKPKVIATALAAGASSSPDAFRAYALPGLTVAGGRTSGYSGRLFEVWQNGSGGASGDPAVSLSYSSNNGTTWSRPVRVNSNTIIEDFQPDVAVTGDGTVFVDWYGMDGTTGKYRLYGAVSRDGGAHFDAQMTISDTDSYPQFSSTGGGNAWWIGDYTDIEGGARGAWTLWTDARSTLAGPCSPCLWGYVYNISFYAALLTNATFASNVPVNLTLNGTVPAPSTLLAGFAPVYRDWIGGERYDVTAPATVTEGNSTAYFALWYGSSISTNTTVSGVVQGPIRYVACYVETPGAPCRAAGAPGQLAIDALPRNATVTIDNSTAPLDAGGRTVLWEYPGNYTIRATSPGHYPINRSIQISTGDTTWVNLSLPWIPGFLVGQVSPAGASVVVSPVGNLTVSSPGRFNASLVPGNYTVTATLFRYASVSANVTIAMLRTSRVNLTLPPLPGWINGTVTPSDARLTVNGTVVAVGISGRFSLVRAPGVYYLNATAAGRISQTSGPVALGPFGAATVSLWLPYSTGLIVGNVSLPGARAWVDSAPVEIVNGSFQSRQAPGVHDLRVTAPSYDPWTGGVDAQANLTTYVPIALDYTRGWIEVASSVPGARTVISAPSFTFRTGTPFNVSLAAGSYRLNTSAPGYLTDSRIVQVQWAQGSYVQIDLAPIPTTTSGTPVWLAPTVAVPLVAIGVLILAWRRRSQHRRRAPPSVLRRPAPTVRAPPRPP